MLVRYGKTDDCHRGFLSENQTLTFVFSLPYRLRQTDVKAGHYERKVQALESERDQWEKKFEEMSKKYTEVKKELADFVAEIGNI
jgi:hypothetical protein